MRIRKTGEFVCVLENWLPQGETDVAWTSADGIAGILINIQYW